MPHLSGGWITLAQGELLTDVDFDKSVRGVNEVSALHKRQSRSPATAIVLFMSVLILHFPVCAETPLQPIFEVKI